MFSSRSRMKQIAFTVFSILVFYQFSISESFVLPETCKTTRYIHKDYIKTYFRISRQNFLRSEIAKTKHFQQQEDSNVPQGQTDPQVDTFFIRQALLVGKFANDDFSGTDKISIHLIYAFAEDLGRASEILADGFYRHKTNFFTYQIEKLNIYLSLDSTYPYRSNIPNAIKHAMLVACRYPDGQVIGFCEVDDQEPGTGTFKGMRKDSARDAPRPYMCNLAVDRTWHRRGVAKALVYACERQIYSSEWTEISSSYLFLKVRSTNEAAISLYKSLGYEVAKEYNNPHEYAPSANNPSEGRILLLRKSLCQESRK